MLSTGNGIAGRMGAERKRQMGREAGKKDIRVCVVKGEYKASLDGRELYQLMNKTGTLKK